MKSVCHLSNQWFRIQIYTWPSGKNYDGTYERGLKHGYGRMAWPDGRMYCGSWKNGKRDGRGIQTKADGSMDHCGLWRKDKACIKGEASASNSICSDSVGSGLSLHSAHVHSQFGGQNTSEEDIVIMEADFVAVADDSLHAAVRAAKGSRDLIAHTTLLASSPPKVQTIPATPTKMDDMSSIGSDHEVTPNFLRTFAERISL
jgi:hypothetical protein